MGRHYQGRITWTAEQLEEIATRWKDMETSGAIAIAMGMSRSAVIGKAQRLGLSKSHPHPKYHPGFKGGAKGGATIGSAIAAHNRNRAPQPVSLAGGGAKKVSPMPQQPLSSAPPAPPTNRRYGPTPILAAGATHCRRPLWSDASTPLEDKLVCGMPKVPGTSYCETCRPLLQYGTPPRAVRRA